MSNNEVSAEFIDDYIKKMAMESEKNRLQLLDNSLIYEEPLVGFASGDDPIFSQYKTIIGEFHMTPRDALEKATGQTPEKVSVISWILPVAEKTKATMRRERTYPTERWAHAREFGEVFNEFVRAQVAQVLTERGYAAVSPYLSPSFQRIVSDTDRTSNWSERHIAYACGLGTFSLNDALITPKGMAMRCGSVVVGLELPPTPRKYDFYAAHCPFMVDGSCGKCIDRCPAGAITEKGHHKIRCFNFQTAFADPGVKRYDLPRIGCGFCQTGVPCESAIPWGLLKRPGQGSTQ
ncbi:MAG: epoxyqueuosine reductase [Chloroflexi bacterium]|nr:epoxyqueuosine reductase [Chloroflexota bacterium]